MGVLIIVALPVWVYVMALDFWKLPYLPVLRGFKHLGDQLA